MCKGGDENPMEQASFSPAPSNEATGRSLQSQSGSSDTRQSHDTAENSPLPTASPSERVKRRSKRDKDGTYSLAREINLKLSSKHAPELPMMTVKPKKEKKRRSSKALMRHGKDSPSGGMEALLPSFIGLGVLVFAVMAQRGFRGRATVAGRTNALDFPITPGAVQTTCRCREYANNGFVTRLNADGSGILSGAVVFL